MKAVYRIHGKCIKCDFVKFYAKIWFTNSKICAIITVINETAAKGGCGFYEEENI